MDGASYNIARLKAGLSSILADVARGYEVIITDHNRPVARLVSIAKPPPLPKADLQRLRSLRPIPLKKGAAPSTALLRRIRDEERY